MSNIEIIAAATMFIMPWGMILIYKITCKHRLDKNFKILQEKYSLTPGQNGNQYNCISGFYRSKPIKIENIEPEGKKKICTRLTVECENPDNFEFTIVKRKRSSNPYYLNGAYIFEDNEFDDLFFIQTNNLELLKRIFDFNSRYKLEQVSGLGFNGEIRLQGNAFTYIEPGSLNNNTAVMKLELILHEMCDLADAMKYDEQLVIINHY